MPVGLAITMCFLASVGIVQALGWLVFSLRPAPCWEPVEVVPLSPDPEQLEAQLRHQLFLLRWSTSPRPRTVILLDGGLGEEAREICRNVLGTGDGFLLCTPRELTALMESAAREAAGKR